MCGGDGPAAAREMYLAVRVEEEAAMEGKGQVEQRRAQGCLFDRHAVLHGFVSSVLRNIRVVWSPSIFVSTQSRQPHLRAPMWDRKLKLSPVGRNNCR